MVPPAPQRAADAISRSHGTGSRHARGLRAPWLVVYRGVAIMLTIFGLNLFGDGLRDLLDPKIRGLQTERQRAG